MLSSVPVWVWGLLAGFLYLQFGPGGETAQEKARRERLRQIQNGEKVAPSRKVTRRPSVARSSSSSSSTLDSRAFAPNVSSSSSKVTGGNNSRYQLERAQLSNYKPSPKASSLRHELSASTTSTAVKRQHDEDESVNKRAKRDELIWDGDSDDSDVPMELDDLASTSYEQETRGMKRSANDDLRTAKRSRQNGTPAAASSPSPRKRRQASSDEDEVAERATRPKRSKVRITKRDIEDVSSDSESELDSDDRPRNADSDVEDDTEAEEEEEAPVRHQFRSKRRDAKRARSTSTRASSEDDDLMSGTLDELESPEPLSPKSPKKRVLPAQRKAATPSSKKKPMPRSKPTPVTKAGGARWTNIEGDEFKIDEQGVKRRRCEVRETRKKYKLPADSKHPDRFATHEVLVEKWLTDEEYDAALKLGILGWQDSPSRGGDDQHDTSMMSVDSANSSSSYFGTPLRRTFSLSRPSSAGQRYSGPPTPAGASPFSSSTTGRLRLASGASPRLRTASRAIRLLEDELQLKQEREKRRAASISFGASAAADAAASAVDDVEPAQTRKEDSLPKSSSTPAPLLAQSMSQPTATFTTSNATAPQEEPKKPDFSFKPASGVDASATNTGAGSKQPAFSFGTSPATAPPSAPPSSGFSFGSASAQQPTAPAAPPTSEAKPFSFGTTTSTTSASSAPSLFGTSAAAAPTGAPSFSFGTSGSTATTAAPSFSFGGNTTTATSNTASAPPPAFSFGAGAPAQASPGSMPAFNLGAGDSGPSSLGQRRVRRLPSSRN